jgi:hypothetical protein
MIVSVGDVVPVLVRSSRERYVVNVQVVGAGSVRLAQSWQELMTPVAGVKQGILVAGADGIVKMWWRGELWALSESGDTYVNFQFA